MLEYALEFPPEKNAQSIRIFGAEEVPYGASRFAIRGRRRVRHDVHGVGHVHMNSRGPFTACRLKRRHCIVHLGSCNGTGITSVISSRIMMLTKIRSDSVAGEMRRNIEGTIATNIIRHGDSTAEILEKLRKSGLEIC